MLTTFVYIPASFAYIIPMIMFGNAITPVQRAVPNWKFAVMGVLDCLAGILQIFAVNGIVSGGLSLLITQSAIPISMVVTYFLLKTKYKWYHIVGATLVMAGVMVVFLPKVVGPHSDSNGTEAQKKMLPVWAGLLVLSCVPSALSNVFKEKALGEVDLDVVYLNGHVALWQFLATLPFAVPAALFQVRECAVVVHERAHCITHFVCMYICK